MEDGEGAQPATSRNAFGRMRRRAPIDHKGDRLAEAAILEIKNGPVEAHAVRPVAAHGRRALQRKTFAPSSRAQRVEIVRTNGEGHDAGTRQGCDAAAAIAFKVLGRIGRDDLQIDPGIEADQAVARA